MHRTSLTTSISIFLSMFFVSFSPGTLHAEQNPVKSGSTRSFFPQEFLLTSVLLCLLWRVQLILRCFTSDLARCKLELADRLIGSIALLPPLSMSQRLLLPMGSCCLITPTRSPSCMETSRSWAALKLRSAWKSFSGPYRTRSPARWSSV